MHIPVMQINHTKPGIIANEACNNQGIPFYYIQDIPVITIISQKFFTNPFLSFLAQKDYFANIFQSKAYFEVN